MADRIPLALHIPLSQIPPNPSPAPPAPSASGAGASGTSSYSVHPATANAAQPASAIQRLVEDAFSKDYDHICVSLTNSNWHDRWTRLCIRDSEADDDPKAQLQIAKEAEQWRMGGGFMRGEVTCTRLEETEHLIGLASDWLQLDSPDEGVRFDAELALRHELALAHYLNVPTVILPPPRNRAHVADYARAVNASLLSTGSYTPQISIRIPISDPAELVRPGSTGGRASLGGDGLGDDGIGGRRDTGGGLSNRLSTAQVGVQDPSATWEIWDVIRTMCGYNPRLSLTLDLTHPLPPSHGALARWAAEPTRHILIPATSFINNPKGYPVLSKATQTFLKEVMKQRPTIILSETSTGRHSSGGPSAYPQYLRHLEKVSRSLHSTSPSNLSTSTTSDPNPVAAGADDFTRGYFDWLQAPLQPLMDDLQSSTYEVFERDPVKYQKYEEAITLALEDRMTDESLAIYVCGAGRGPLVAIVLRAMEQTGRKARVYAVEKNAAAFVTLQERQALEWGSAVTILFGDMRTLDVPEPASIIVSELLGSFGDNELSPECLDGAMRFLKPDGISIPSSYTAYLSPLSSSKLYNEVTSRSSTPAASASTGSTSAAETPYVVMFQAVNTLSGNPDTPSSLAVDGTPILGADSGRCGGQVQACWAFDHPRRDVVLDARGLPLTNSHNTRSAHLSFHIPHAGALHGLAGYFEAVLYGDVGLSIHPDRMHSVSPNMVSWFPLFFPFKEPLFLPRNSELDVHIWRLTDARSRKVWYEWHAEAFLPLPSTSSHPSVFPPSTPHQTPHFFSPTSSVPSRPTSPHNSILSNHTSRTAGGGPNGGGYPGGSQPVTGGAAGRGSIGGGSYFAGEMNGGGEDGVRMGGGGRLKIGQTSLHNPGGRGSWIGL